MSPARPTERNQRIRSWYRAAHRARLPISLRAPKVSVPEVRVQARRADSQVQAKASAERVEAAGSEEPEAALAVAVAAAADAEEGDSAEARAEAVDLEAAALCRI